MSFLFRKGFTSLSCLHFLSDFQRNWMKNKNWRTSWSPCGIKKNTLYLLGKVDMPDKYSKGLNANTKSVKNVNSFYLRKNYLQTFILSLQIVLLVSFPFWACILNLLYTFFAFVCLAAEMSADCLCNDSFQWWIYKKERNSFNFVTHYLFISGYLAKCRSN